MKKNSSDNLQNNSFRHGFPLLTLLFLIHFIFSAFGQTSLIEVQASVDKSVITIGDRITYSLKINRSESLRIQQPGPGTNLGMFEIKDYKIQKPRKQNGRVIERFDFVISVFDTGYFEIPPFPVAFFPSDTSKKYQIIKSEPIEIYVKSVLTAEDVELKDIKAPLQIPANYWRWVFMGAGGVLALLALLLGYFLYRRHRRGEPIFRKEVIRPAHEIALEELQKLLNSSFLQGKKFKAFCTELSNILRRYLENRFFIKAMEETTAELLHSLQEVGIPEEAFQKLGEILHLCNLVKFAKYVPTEKETEQMVALTKSFIDQTRLVFEPVEVLEKIESSAESSTAGSGGSNMEGHD